MKEMVEGLIESLQGTLPHLDGLAEAEPKLEATKADLASVEQELEAKKSALADANSAFSAAQLEAQRKHDEAIYGKQQELKALEVRVNASKQILSETEAKAAAALANHREIEASLESLRKKFG